LELDKVVELLLEVVGNRKDPGIERLIPEGGDIVTEQCQSDLSHSVRSFVDKLVARSIQGSPLPLCMLVHKISSLLTDTVSIRLEDLLQTTHEVAQVDRIELVKAYVQHVATNGVEMEEAIKAMAQRRAHGVDRKCNLFEDTELAAARIWELYDSHLIETYDKYSHLSYLGV
jgi:hypothetical protein